MLNPVQFEESESKLKKCMILGCEMLMFVVLGKIKNQSGTISMILMNSVIFSRCILKIEVFIGRNLAAYDWTRDCVDTLINCPVDKHICSLDGHRVRLDIELEIERKAEKLCIENLICDWMLKSVSAPNRIPNLWSGMKPTPKFKVLSVLSKENCQFVTKRTTNQHINPYLV